LRHPITTYEGKILDGKLRYEACLAAGVEPTFKEYKGNDPEGLVISANVMRKHWTSGQLAMIAAKMHEKEEFARVWNMCAKEEPFSGGSY
jgi:hypothetical protein